MGNEEEAGEVAVAVGRVGELGELVAVAARALRGAARLAERGTQPGPGEARRSEAPGGELREVLGRLAAEHQQRPLPVGAQRGAEREVRQLEAQLEGVVGAEIVGAGARLGAEQRRLAARPVPGQQPRGDHAEPVPRAAPGEAQAAGAVAAQRETVGRLEQQIARHGAVGYRHPGRAPGSTPRRPRLFCIRTL